MHATRSADCIVRLLAKKCIESRINTGVRQIGPFSGFLVNRLVGLFGQQPAGWIGCDPGRPFSYEASRLSGFLVDRASVQ